MEKGSLTKKQKWRYTKQIIEAGFFLSVAVILVFGIGGVIKLWMGQQMSQWDMIILTINVVILIMKNSIEFAVYGINQIKSIQKRVVRKRNLNKKKKEKSSEESFDY